MHMLFIYGAPASGKLTIAREVADRTGFALFHNHLIVDALLAVFPFGSDAFVRLREQFWLETMSAAARGGRSLIFTFAPEPTVDPHFPAKAEETVRRAGGAVTFIRLDVSEAEQERRLGAMSRSAFGKLRDLNLFRSLKNDFAAALRSMPSPALSIDTTQLGPGDAADRIVALTTAHGQLGAPFGVRD